MASYYRLEGSKDVVSSDLDLFLTPPTNSGVEQVEWVDYRPVNSVGLNGTVEFRVPGSGMHYIDMKRTYLYVGGLPIDEDGEVFETASTDLLAAKIAPANNILHSLWSQVDVTLNQKLVSSHTAHYAYKAMLESTLNYDKSAQESQMQSAGFYKRQNGFLDPQEGTITNIELPDGDSSFKTTIPNPKYNPGVRARYLSWAKGDTLMGPLFADLFQQDRLLLNGVEIGVQLYRHQPEFYMNAATSDQKKYQIAFENLSLRVCKVKLSPQLQLSHEKMLETVPAKYPYLRSELKTITMPANVSTYRVENLFQGKVPSRLVITGIEDYKAVGTLTEDPFVFNISGSKGTVKVDGISTPMQTPMGQGDAQRGNDVESFFSEFNSLNRQGSDFGTMRDRAAGQDTFFCYDLTGMGMPSLETYPLFRRGEVSLEFTLPSIHNKTLLVLAYFPDMYQVDKSRNVIM